MPSASKVVAAAVTRSAAVAVASRHVVSGIRPLAPRFPRRVLATHTIPTAGWTRPVLCFHPALPIARRGLAGVSDDGLPGLSDDLKDPYEDMPSDWFDPETPVPEFDYGEEDLESHESMWALYKRWQIYYGIDRTHEDMLQRFYTFKENARRAHEFNKCGASFTVGLMDWADMTLNERHIAYPVLRPRPIAPE